MILQIPCQRIISGGQTGVDRGALDACLDMNFPCGGTCPKNRLAEDGTIPQKYPLTEAQESTYEFRTRQNVIKSDGTLILSGVELTGGTLLTSELAQKLEKPFLIISPEDSPDTVLNWITNLNIKILNAAGPRESEWPEAYEFSYQFFTKLIQQIRKSY